MNFRVPKVVVTLTCARLVSSRALRIALVFVAMTTTLARAHEIRPAIADVEIGAGELHLTIRLALESLVAGIDLEGLADTNDAPQAADYDKLRALPPSALEAEFRRDWPRLQLGFDIRAGGGPILPEIGFVEVGEVGDPGLARDTVIGLTVPLPPGDAPVTVAWRAAYGPLVLRQMGAGEGAYTGYLTGGQTSEPLPRTGAAQQGALNAFVTYVRLGFEHIVPKGLDHILFVLGLFFFSMRMRPLLMQVTAFTVAHTVSLALATLKIVTVAPEIVEPLIAASIVYVAVENILWQKMTPWRPMVVFGFGLLHGLGFASVLGEIGLEPGRFVTGLIGFNIGVELGQLAVIAGAFLLVGLWFGTRPWYRRAIQIPASVAIAIVGGYWFVERTFL